MSNFHSVEGEFAVFHPERRHCSDPDQDLDAIPSSRIHEVAGKLWNFFLYRDSDGVPLAKGNVASQLYQMQKTFFTLGVKCSIGSRSGTGTNWSEGESRSAFLGRSNAYKKECRGRKES